jgi:acyl dehydratase
MGLNLDLIGKKSEPTAFKYTPDQVILYALGIGANVEQELDFVYEKNLRVFPTFAVIPYMPAMGTVMGEAGLNMPTVLHGEQQIVLHGLIPPSGTVYSSAVWSSVYDKGDKGAILNIDIETKDESGKLLFENKAAIVDRSAGNFGGDRGPKGERLDPPEGKTPDFHVQYSVSPDQAALYRLSGDKNPLHIEPEFAQMGGLDRPILHGLCTFGYTGRAILHSVCNGDPARLKSFSVRFTGMVYPGETLIIDGWQKEAGKYIVQTKTRDGRVVLGNALAEVA